MNGLEKLMNDLGVNSFDELLQWVNDNKDTPLAKSIMEVMNYTEEMEENKA